jgi:hypothetical protein
VLLTQDFNWDIFFPIHPFSPDRAASDFHTLEAVLIDIHMGSNVVKKTVKERSSLLAADLYNAGIQKFIAQYGKCLNLGRDYVEKYFRSVVMM